MTSPVITVAAESRASDALLTMLDRGIRHLPLVTGRGEIVGVLRDIDLLALEARTPFVLRRAIAHAQDVEDLKRAAARLNGIVLALYDARMNAAHRARNSGDSTSRITAATTARMSNWSTLLMRSVAMPRSIVRRRLNVVMTAAIA